MKKKWVMLSVGILAIAAVITVLLGTTGSAIHAGGARPPAADIGPATAMSASASTTTESSIVIAMGHLHDPSNTFWELFVRPAGDSSWVLHTPPGVASNGGLVLAAPPVGPLTVGFVTSAGLKFSPIAQSSDGGRIWSPGELPFPLVATPNSLAVGPNGDVVAVVDDSGQSVLETSSQLSVWRTLISKMALGADTSTCRVTDVTAAAFNDASQPVLGLGCARAGNIGVLAPVASSSAAPGRWRPIGPPLDRGDGAVSVVRLESTATGLAGLAVARAGRRSSFVAFWGTGSTDQWSAPVTFAVPAGWSVEATATGGGSGQGFAVLLGSGARRRVELISGPGASWTMLPPAPQGASGVSDLDTELDTFVVSGSRLTVWALPSGAARWRRTAVILVPVPYGSSS